MPSFYLKFCNCFDKLVIGLHAVQFCLLHLVPLPLLRSAVCSNGKPTSTDCGKKWDGKNGKCKSYGQLEKPVWLRSLCSRYTETENCLVGDKVSWQLSIEGAWKCQIESKKKLLNCKLGMFDRNNQLTTFPQTCTLDAFHWHLKKHLQTDRNGFNSFLAKSSKRDP